MEEMRLLATKFCEYCGTEIVNSKAHRIDGMELCRRHYLQWYRHHKFIEKTIYDPNDIILYENYAEIILRNKNGDVVATTKIDLEDVEKCRKYKWHWRRGRKKTDTGYAIATTSEKEKIHLHRYVLSYTGDDDVDHINHDGLDNRKANLRIVSHAVNLLNQKDDRKGVKQTPSGKWQASITINYISIYLGTFDNYESAYDYRTQCEQNYREKGVVPKQQNGRKSRY